MLNLTEYRNRTTGLVDYRPWACLIAPGVVLNKDGSFQRSFVYRGPDLESSTEAELVAFTARFNTILKRSNPSWGMFFEEQRIPAQVYPAGQNRRAQFDEQGAHFKSRYLLTFVYLPLPEIADRKECIFFASNEPLTEPDHARTHLDAFLTETDRAAELMGAFLPELEPLDDVETLTYLHGTISTKQHVVRPTDVPIEHDAFLCDASPDAGFAPRPGDKHVRVLIMPSFPNTTTSGLLDELNDLGFSCCWIALDRVTGNKQLSKLCQQKSKSDGAVLPEEMFNRETALVDSDADNKATDANTVLQEFGTDAVAFQHVTTSLVVSDQDEQAVDGKPIALERILDNRGFTTIREILNSVGTWLGSLSGNNPDANLRRPIVHTLNLAHKMPVTAVWAAMSYR